MPHRCSAPNCRGNLAGGPKVSTFKFPVDPVLRQKWLHALKREDFVPKEHSRVSKNHLNATKYVLHF